MSTFDGRVEAAVDYFRKRPERPPLACFLSHVHSDHLQGLESFRAPFIYCSPATRELLLRIEKYPHRMNFRKGILESRRLHYKHLAKLLRPIPLNTPTEIELTPRRRVRITLFDANHCIGAVMFLIEGDGKAILYTGDIRAERWWINSVVRNPVLIPYTLGQKRLDKLYLDTTFARAVNKFHEFPSKAVGLSELLRKVEAYPDGTVFYFRAWTFGYEDVWMALSAALNTKVHVDQYQMGLYRSLMRASGTHSITEASALCGFSLGNRAVAGCLSSDAASRVHSCEPGVTCPTARSPSTVYIVPIVNRTIEGVEIPEVGAGGGIGDLYQTHELELPDEATLEELEKLCLQHIHDEQLRQQLRITLIEAFRSKRKALSLDEYGMKEEGDISLKKLVDVLSHGMSEGSSGAITFREPVANLPKTIRFPYSRHSSYAELCDFIAAFRPKDIHPCTVDESTWTEDVSIRRLFGHLCTETRFSHDAHMWEILGDADENDKDGPRARKRTRYNPELSTQSTEGSSNLVMDDELSTGSREQTQTQTASPSCGTIQESINKPLNFPLPSPETAKAKRNEIRQARRYLQEHTDREMFHVGALPSSWRTEGDELEPEKKNKHVSEVEEKLTTTDSTETREVSETDRQGDGATDLQMESQQADSQHTALSISESAFASPLPVEEHSVRLSEDNEPDSEITPTHHRPRTHTHARIAAYLAARADSYSAWTDVSLVSAGDNHTEEEIEL
ncbi:DNA repair metallo-beta-lactamase [Penicillium riverlandense]|uniref:DNA repair metallo-beta-lactamase n=1 Tax=Penicillium riverlandense TaxID=1903569 RepID=UPI0025469917|nr:DNA repair metallo-beta-lactamase [Penicillium riverlandense]KAJ5807753.1 DNA repair metallo-beta-lactamase [Penicillium riverlandense]